MSIVHIPRRFTRNAWGGTETCITQIAKAQNQLGLNAKIFTTQALDDVAKEDIQGISVTRFPYFYPMLGLSKQAKQQLDYCGGNLFSTGLFQGLLKQKKLRMLHAHTGNRVGAIVRTVAKLRNCPYVITLHGGKPADVQAQPLNKTNKVFEWGRALGAIMGSHKVLKDAAAVICVDKSQAVWLKTEHPEIKSCYLPNGVDHQFFSTPTQHNLRQHYGIDQHQKLILQVGRIDPQKNQLFMLSVFARLLQNSPNTVLMLVGPCTNQGYLKQLRAAINHQGLNQKVKIISDLQHDDTLLAAAYQQADVLCLPSVHEPFGLVILEAWSAKLPVVAAKLGGICSFAEHGKDSLLLATDDIESWTRAIELHLRQPDYAKTQAFNGYSKTKQHYDWSVINHRLLDLYREVLS